MYGETSPAGLAAMKEVRRPPVLDKLPVGAGPGDLDLLWRPRRPPRPARAAHPLYRRGRPSDRYAGPEASPSGELITRTVRMATKEGSGSIWTPTMTPQKTKSLGRGKCRPRILGGRMELPRRGRGSSGDLMGERDRLPQGKARLRFSWSDGTLYGIQLQRGNGA